VSHLPDWLNFSSYTYAARIRPVLFASVPLAIVLWVWTYDLLAAGSWLISFAVAAGVPFALGEKAADAGRRRQPDLWASWGGAPTGQLLRHRDGTLNPHVLAAIHRSLERICHELRLPSAPEEEADPEGADAIYEACADRLRVIARSQPETFPLVHSANTSYGFRRNLWAIRAWAIAAAVIGACGTGFYIVLEGPEPRAIVGGGLCLIFLAVVIGVVRRDWVREAAFIYAHRLAESAEAMASQSTP
jgi:hypothetical protein